MFDDEQPRPPFSTEELRILGCLMEKQLTTPASYPLTFNALANACNQKSSREPVMSLTEGVVGHTAKVLVEGGWTAIQYSERAQRVAHQVERRLKLNRKQQAILCVLLLRRPQTLNEIKTRTERMADFASIDEIREILDTWLAADKPLVMRLPASAGRREDRYFHTLSTEKLEALQEESPGSNASSNTSAPRHDAYAALEARVAELEQRLASLESQLN
ncbi:DUF480 domain-containing protein [Thiothrix lacustris]|uniref:DUF480 domain-containing protein n=1 Tax=Thiothrix lacustris TaxID=525917 RepID=A0ABY9MS33_9GAMM|nr:DUF480 domain-containing protein [Thiothrix lacustris]WML91367.1 DUF480 domain-containing protein [Thiothrix lacustris]